MRSVFQLSVAYYPEHWPRENWDRDFAAIRKAGFTAVRMFEFAWCRMEPSSGNFSFSMMDEAIRLAAEHGLKTILCTPTEAPPPWLWSRHPEILPVDVRGLTTGASSRRHGCPSNETFLLYCDRITEQLAQRYGSNEDVIAWQLDNEAGCHVNMRCYCESCQKKFREWVKHKYQTVENLNRAWGLIFWSGEVTSFDQVTLHTNHLTISNPGYELDVSRFQSDNWIEFLARQAEIIRRYSNTQAITHNETWYAEQINGYHLGKHLDFMGIDSYPSDPALNTMTDEMYFSMKRKPFAVMEMGSGTTAIDSEEGMVITGVGKVSMVIRHMMNGAFCCSLFRYRPAPSGGEMESANCSLVHHDGTTTKTMLAFEKHQGLLHKLSDALFAYDEGGKMISDVHYRVSRSYEAAIILDYDDFLMIYSTPKGRNPDKYCADILGTDYMKDMLYWHSALSKAGLRVTFLPPDADLTPYPMVVAHEKWTMTPDFGKKLKAYAEQGGVVVGADRFGSHVPQGRMSCVTLPGYATDLFGVRFNEQYSARRNPVALQTPEGNTFVSRMILPLEIDEDTEVLGVYKGGDLEGKPALTVHDFGKGRAYFVGALLERDGVEMAAKIITREIQKPAPILTAENENVEVLTRGNIVACLNTSAKQQRITLRPGMIDFDMGSAVDEAVIEPFGFLLLEDTVVQ